MKIYIAGAITDNPDYLGQFYAAEAKLIKEMIAETIMDEYGKTPTEFVCELEEFDPSMLCQ